ncbi:MAG: hypothetical protein WBO49_01295 [Candidatus Saccharimonas sp.]
MAPLLAPPVPQKVKWDCTWVRMFTGSWGGWLSKWTTLLVVTGSILAVAGMSTLIVLARTKSGSKFTDVVFTIIMWTGVVIVLVTLILPKVSFLPCNPFR